LVNLESIKIFEQKTGIQVKEKKNVYIDYNELFVVPTKNNLYPLIIEINNGNVIRYEFQSPDNSLAFARLSDILRKKSP
jgi:hypothetical protein